MNTFKNHSWIHTKGHMFISAYAWRQMNIYFLLHYYSLHFLLNETICYIHMFFNIQVLLIQVCLWKVNEQADE